MPTVAPVRLEIGDRLGRVERSVVARRSVVGDAGQPEVGHADPAIRADEHIVGLEVAVDQAGAMGDREAARRRGEHGQDLPPAAPLAAQPARQGHAVDVLHGDEDLLADRADLVDGGDVRARQARHRLRLAQHGSAGGLAGQSDVGAQELQRHAPVKLVIPREVDHAHRARAEVAADRVMTEPRPHRHEVVRRVHGRLGDRHRRRHGGHAGERGGERRAHHVGDEGATVVAAVEVILDLGHLVGRKA